MTGVTGEATRALKIDGTDRDGFRHFRIGIVTVAVRSDLDEVLDDFTALYGASRCPAPGRGQEVVRMRVRAGRRTLLARRRYDVEGDGAVISAGLAPTEVLPHLEWAINHRVIATRPEFLQIHAATLARGDRGVILAGTSGAGKSTLAAGLLARGWRYLCDEFALIDPIRLTLHPYPKAVCVKAGAFDVIDRLGLSLSRGRHYVKVLKGRVGYVRPPAGGTADSGVPVGLVLFPRYTGAGAPRVRSISRARALFTLAGHAFNPAAHGDRTIPILERLVAGTPCLRLESGEIEATCDLIESL